MTGPEPDPAAVRDLLRQAYALVCGRLDGDIAINAALLTTVEAALGLAELRADRGADPGQRSERLSEVYRCTRAAATAVRFAVVEADDLRRVRAARRPEPRPAPPVEAAPVTYDGGNGRRPRARREQPAVAGGEG
ncbi:hypothetical protein Q3W71_14755 [Micromonospora sp. C28SCA-DRY-2]|uniref:hypothetical protein n=1 Tax=Micromonospora sp. C28SCA-DRY-2 TaxID=3059522 RepID=UPI002674E9B4|nr:hypothetical protein [Micromonospora sp. C28SCA-DRY-2]MDO3702930.1 hypothetical protein [Micromonospora sp. C28SCA-DRY-2]